MPQTPDPGAAWSELTDEVIGLTSKVKETYHRVSDESGPTDEEIKAALQTLAGAWNQVAWAVGTAVREPEVRDHLKRAIGALVDAVSTSLSDLGTDRSSDAEGAS